MIGVVIHLNDRCVNIPRMSGRRVGHVPGGQVENFGRLKASFRGVLHPVHILEKKLVGPKKGLFGS